jgi:hypothetical protein
MMSSKIYNVIKKQNPNQHENETKVHHCIQLLRDFEIHINLWIDLSYRYSEK